MRIFKISLISLISTILSSCGHSGNNAAGTITNQCPSSEEMSFNGQILYSEGMVLKIPDCKLYNNSGFGFTNAVELRKIWAKIDLSQRGTYQYVDLTFTGYINSKGKLIIEYVEYAEVAKQNLFEDFHEYWDNKL